MGGGLAPLGPLWLDVIEPASIGVGQRDILAVLIQYNVLEHTDRQGMRSGCSRIMMQIPHVQSRPVRTLQDQVELWIEIDPPIIDKQLDDGVVLAESSACSMAYRAGQPLARSRAPHGVTRNNTRTTTTNPEKNIRYAGLGWRRFTHQASVSILTNIQLRRTGRPSVGGTA